MRPHLRPRFTLDVPCPSADATRKLKQYLDSPAGPYEGSVVKRHAQIQVRGSARRVWSPWLSFVIEETPTGCRFDGKFTPHPNVWTFFLALYALAVLLGVGAGIFTLVQRSLGESPWGLWLVAAAVLIGGGATVAAWLGPGLGAEDMVAMAQFVEKSVSEVERDLDTKL